MRRPYDFGVRSLRSYCLLFFLSFLSQKRDVTPLPYRDNAWSGAGQGLAPTPGLRCFGDGDSNETKPIRTGIRFQGAGISEQTLRLSRQTKPIRPGATRTESIVWERSYDRSGPQRASAKQSQFAGTDRDGRGPTGSPAELALRLIAQNEPNLLAMGTEDHRQGQGLGRCHP